MDIFNIINASKELFSQHDSRDLHRLKRLREAGKYADDNRSYFEICKKRNELRRIRVEISTYEELQNDVRDLKAARDKLIEETTGSNGQVSTDILRYIEDIKKSQKNTIDKKAAIQNEYEKFKYNRANNRDEYIKNIEAEIKYLSSELSTIKRSIKVKQTNYKDNQTFKIFSKVSRSIKSEHKYVDQYTDYHPMKVLLSIVQPSKTDENPGDIEKNDDLCKAKFLTKSLRKSKNILCRIFDSQKINKDVDILEQYIQNLKK
tara:strand:+ start:1459 stop:2241 length:783 start_codon:yes stop_codon:yes gene_type:complete